MSKLYTKEYIQKLNDLKQFFEEQNHDSELIDGEYDWEIKNNW